MSFADWSTTDANNATTLGVNIGEGCPPSNVNNAIRAVMAQMRTAINPVMDAFLASTSLSSAATALGVSPGSTSTSNFSALTNAANKVPYMTGSDNWATADFTSFGRSVVACGDATTLNTLLGSGGGTNSSISAASGYVTFKFGSTTFMLVWKDASVASNTTTTVTYPQAFTSWSRAWCSGSTFDTSGGANFPCISGETTTGCSVVNGLGSSVSTTIFAIGV